MRELESNTVSVCTVPPESTDDGRAGFAAIPTTLGLTACGGGGDSAPLPSSDPPDPPDPPSLLKPTSDTEAARFLLQAQFSAPDADIAALKADGYVAWLAARYSEPLGQKGVQWLDAQGYQTISSEQRYFRQEFGDFMIWNQLIAGPDQMRKRCALALSEFFVVSLTPIDGFFPSYLIAHYWDTLTQNAHGNFRALLEQVTLNAAMGFYLNTKGNQKESANGRQPDENFAREVMQLFTIGLHELNSDGTPKLDANDEPIETYSQEDVTNLARVFTGYDWDYLSNGGFFTDAPWRNGDVPNTRFATNAMTLTASKHSNREVSFLGLRIPANTSGPDALDLALDQLFNHSNVAPFFARQMIQRLVTSNPSPAYVGRVAAAFANNGSGVRGDLTAVWTAILADSEARAMPTASDTLSGKLREPIMRFVQWARTAGIVSANGKYEIGDMSGADRFLGQSPLRSSSVFNFFRPGYVPPNTALASANHQAPEFQLHNESSTAGYINFMERVTRDGYNDVKPGYSELLPLAHDVPAVVSWLNLRLSANQMSENSLELIRQTLSLFGVTVASSRGRRLDLLATACLLFLSSPEYLVQK